MFGKKRKPEAAVNLEVRGSVLGSSTASPGAFGHEFRLTTDLQSDPRSQWQCMINPGTTELLLFAPHGGGTQVELRSLPPNTWITLRDPNGKRLPLDARVDRLGAYGRWVSTSGDYSDPHEHDLMSEAERRQMTNDAFAALSNEHYKVMNWISNIR